MVQAPHKEKVTGIPEFIIRDPYGTLHCPGCHESIAQRLIGETLEEMELMGKAVGVAGCGCASGFFLALDFDSAQTAHGRPPDVATGIKRFRPNSLVFTVQGDGDAIAIGTEPLIQAAARSEKITVVMLNNANYGMTGGQMAPTTLLDMVTTTTPTGREPSIHGYPIRVAELLSNIPGVVYSARGALHTPAHYQRTKKMLKIAFQKQIDNVGFSFLEILSACPTDWHLTPVDALKFVDEKMIAYYPLGEFKNVDKVQQ